MRCNISIETNETKFQFKNSNLKLINRAKPLKLDELRKVDESRESSRSHCSSTLNFQAPMHFFFIDATIPENIPTRAMTD